MLTRGPELPMENSLQGGIAVAMNVGDGGRGTVRRCHGKTKFEGRTVHALVDCSIADALQLLAHFVEHLWTTVVEVAEETASREARSKPGLDHAAYRKALRPFVISGPASLT